MTNSIAPTTEASLRDYQQEAIDRLRDSLRAGSRRPMLQSPTGSGKTLVASTVVRMARDKGKRVIFCVPSLSLIDQTVEAFYKDGIWDVGVVQSQHEMTNWEKKIQVASVQTLMRRWPRCPEADMVIVDEAHVMFEHYGRWMTDPAWRKTPFIGLSATPWTKGLGVLYDDLLILTTTQELIDQGYLSKFRVMAPSHPDLRGVRTVAGDYQATELGAAMNTSPLVADVVETWLRHADGRPTLCFAVDRAHAKHLQKQFEAAGVTCGYQDMNTTPLERREIKDKFHAGEYKVVTNCDTLTVGVDWDVRCISLVRPTKSKMKFVQIIGRGLRTADGKDDCLILDHSDNHIRLGFVTEIGQDRLNDGKGTPTGEKEVVLPKECPKCSYLRPPRVSLCPNCGFKPERKEPAPNQKGELVELRPKETPKRVKGDAVLLGTRLIPKRDLYGELRAYGVERGRSSGWASNSFRELTGVWPNAYRDAPQIMPSMEVRAWARSKDIRWAKRVGNTRQSGASWAAAVERKGPR